MKQHEVKAMSRVVEDAQASEADFVVYSTTFCPYCVAVKRLFDSKGLTYDEINFDHEPGARNDVVAETGHRTTDLVDIFIIKGDFKCLTC